MKVGDLAALFSHDGFRRKLTILEVGVTDPLGSGLACYRTSSGLGTFKPDLLFYIKPELGTGRRYNAGNRAFWIEPITEQEP
jgi:hypothetical protein